MILYNVTTIVDETIHTEWKQWMLDVYVDEVMSSGCFVSNRMLRVLDSPNEGVTYCVQYIADSINKYNEYQEKFANRTVTPVPAGFMNKFVTFSTLMEFIDSK